MTDQSFSPALASRRLREVALELEAIGAKIVDQRMKTVMAEAAYLDAKAESRRKNAELMGVTALQQQIDMDSLEQKKDFIRAEAALRNLQDQRDIIIESNNCAKKAIDIWMTELSSLKYAP
jgi:hypothetical protein